jgi:mycothiol system anti-sigma-R factor
MACDLSHDVLHGYLDGELDAARASEFERHLETCRECVGALESQEALRASLQRMGLYERAPATLQQKIRRGLDAATVTAISPRRFPTRWVLAVAAAILLVALVSWVALPRFLGGPNPTTVTAAELVDAHVRSLQPGHLTDVTSTDQHTVKPWFDGRIDFIPPVKDFADEGFSLIGGRLDVLNGRSVAALVYGRRKHLINVFVWPTQEPDSAFHSSKVHQGFQWVHWRHQGMEFCAVSDIADPELRQLAQLFVE